MELCSGRHAVKGRLKERVTDDDLRALVTCGDEIFSSEKLNGTNDNEINRNGYVPSPQISSVMKSLSINHLPGRCKSTTTRQHNKKTAQKLRQREEKLSDQSQTLQCILQQEPQW
ncbi:hypothetical protein YC2023_020518 [Brassica napus]